MIAPANAERAASADAALFDYMSRTRYDCEDCLAYLLCDLMHWADQCELNFHEEFDLARSYYNAEVGEGGL